LLYLMLMAQTFQLAVHVVPIGFFGTVYNVILISYSFSSACIFCMIFYCLKHNKLLEILIIICKLLFLVEMVHPETVVSICDGTSCGNYI
jgi:hypothetical protein